ncbi:protein mono-ADP-ribosyltransferase PARP16 isoform X1 [Paramormyrops kingsleyae]|uniref:Poly [ADP-ribose] polymerase n=1 Tax=Paramormyrops kingsleyae TaxID=1676925 RepID=A0A3B3T4W7_9TELE|nr:mono [ADP-ribose] polymerase PARP16 isoform X1 [Paramormyrops kingsleyae]
MATLQGSSARSGTSMDSSFWGLSLILHTSMSVPGMQPPLPPATVRELVRSCLHRDPVAADLRCSLFVAAALTYKRDSVLRPFPRRYASEDNKEFEALLADVSSMPGVRELVRLGPGEGEHHLALAHWVLSSRNFAVRTLQRDEYSRILELTGCEGTSMPSPDFLFELEYCNQMNAMFEKTRDGRDILYAFHGSRLENFHSIIHNGLHCHLNKTSLFGEGTYLTSDLSLAVLYSPHGNGWRESLLGPLLSCIAVCEIIDHPDVKCQVKKKDSEGMDRRRARVKNSEGGEVPQKYFVVTNNQLLRVKYLLVYSQKRRSNRRPHGSSWLARHHFAITMSLYLLLLVFIGAFSSAGFQAFWHRLFRS